MERNLKYWFYYIGKTSLQVLAMILGIVAVCSFFDGGNFIERFVAQLPLYLGMMCLMIVVVYGFTNITTIFPLTVSFGARRKTSIIAMMIVNHIIFVILAALAIASLLYSYPKYIDYLGLLWPLLIAGITILMFFGNLVSMFSNKFGRTAGIIFYVVFVIVVSVLVGLCVGFAKDLTILAAASTLAFGTFIIIAIVGILLDIFSVWLTVKSVEKKDMTF